MTEPTTHAQRHPREVDCADYRSHAPHHWLTAGGLEYVCSGAGEVVFGGDPKPEQSLSPDVAAAVEALRIVGDEPAKQLIQYRVPWGNTLGGVILAFGITAALLIVALGIAHYLGAPL